MKYENEKKSKLPYEKPRLRTIPLAADEVLAVNCKMLPGSPGKDVGGGRCGISPCASGGPYGS